MAEGSSEDQRRARRAARDRADRRRRMTGAGRARRRRHGRRPDPQPRLRPGRRAARRQSSAARDDPATGAAQTTRAARLRATTRRSTTSSRYTPYIVRGSRRSKEVALTFDDGPGPTTPALVRYLVVNGVPATFFLVGKAIAERPGIVRKQHEAGFALGTHTQSHARLGSKSAAEQSQEILVGRRPHHADHGARGEALPPAVRLVRRRARSRSCARSGCSWCCGTSTRRTTRRAAPSRSSTRR